MYTSQNMLDSIKKVEAAREANAVLDLFYSVFKVLALGSKILAVDPSCKHCNLGMRNSRGAT